MQQIELAQRRRRLWKVLGRFWTSVECSGAFLDVCGMFWGVSGRLWKVLGRLRRLWKVLGRLRHLWKVLGRFWTSVTAAVAGGAIPSARAAAQCCQF